MLCGLSVAVFKSPAPSFPPSSHPTDLMSTQDVSHRIAFPLFEDVRKAKSSGPKAIRTKPPASLSSAWIRGSVQHRYVLCISQIFDFQAEGDTVISRFDWSPESKSCPRGPLVDPLLHEPPQPSVSESSTLEFHMVSTCAKLQAVSLRNPCCCSLACCPLPSAAARSKSTALTALKTTTRQHTRIPVGNSWPRPGMKFQT